MARFDDHMPTRPVDRDKAESELSIHIKKATSTEETAPKQKHVRKCIVYTWDYRTSQSIWTGLRVQPILSDEVQTFKALILVHKVLQEGHQVVLKEAQAQIGWFETCARTVGADSMRGYGALIRAYVNFILAKLRFHRHHKEFNGLFEYEEYISLKNIDNPDEGYETIMDLMNLQDQIDQFQKLVFAHFRGSANNECASPLSSPRQGELRHLQISYLYASRHAPSHRRQRRSPTPSRALRLAAPFAPQVLLRMRQPQVPHLAHQRSQTQPRAPQPL